MTERKPPGVSFETWADKQIRDAEGAATFAALAGKGKPLASLDAPYDELWWVKRQDAARGPVRPAAVPGAAQGGRGRGGGGRARRRPRRRCGESSAASTTSCGPRWRGRRRGRRWAAGSSTSRGRRPGGGPRERARARGGDGARPPPPESAARRARPRAGDGLSAAVREAVPDGFDSVPMPPSVGRGRATSAAIPCPRSRRGRRISRSSR